MKTPTTNATVVAVDWSGRRTREERAIWMAVATNAAVVRLESGRTRETVMAELRRIASSATYDAPVVIGLDFSFSFPRWFAHEQRCTTVDMLWNLVAAEGEAWLRDSKPPFWGRPGCPRPDLPAHFRFTEQAVQPVGGIRPKSTFQIGGAGSVGSGSIRGMALLNHLRSAPCAIWPFDPPAPATAFELYPRWWTGPVVKSNRHARATYLQLRAPMPPHQSIDQRFVAQAIDSEDAFDALITALSISASLAISQTGLTNILFQPPQTPAGMSQEAFSRIVAIEGWIPAPPINASPEGPHIS